VTAESECDESPLATSGYVVATTQCNSKPTAAPTNIKAEALSSTEIKISWDAVSGMTTEDNYLLYRSESRNGTYIYATGTSGIYQSMTITNFSPSTTYYFKMRTQNNCGESELSTSFDSTTTKDCDLPVPPAPTGVTAEALSARSVQVSWDAVEGAASYDVYRGTARGSMFWTVSGGRSLTENFFTDTTVSASTTYYYTVKSVNSCGGETDDLDGDVVEAITLCETPIPTNVSAAAKSPSSIEITWNEVPNAVSYSVYRASTANGTYTLIDRTDANSSTDTGLESLTTYHYKVTAKTALCDESKMSINVFGTTPKQ
jgi:fibronectin type 3 domain-containing protein